MCKIAILSPNRVSEQKLTIVAMELYRSQRSGLGIVGINEKEEVFDYSVEKWVEPAREDVRAFIGEIYDDSKWIILHGRLATSGKINHTDSTHPISIECEHCDLDYVLHNGVYSSREVPRQIEDLEDAGHNFTTGVDSELMAHRIGKVPETIDEADDLLDDTVAGYEPGIILLGENRFLIYTNKKYRIDENGEMYVPYANYKNNSAEKNYSMMIVTAGGKD